MSFKAASTVVHGVFRTLVLHHVHGPFAMMPPLRYCNHERPLVFKDHILLTEVKVQ